MPHIPETEPMKMIRPKRLRCMLRDARWVVRFEYEARKRKQLAEWEVDLKAGALTPRNRLGSDLGYVESGRRRRPGPPVPTGGGLLSRPAPALAWWW